MKRPSSPHDIKLIRVSVASNHQGPLGRHASACPVPIGESTTSTA